jgi:hypothetical protein
MAMGAWLAVVYDMLMFVVCMFGLARLGSFEFCKDQKENTNARLEKKEIRKEGGSHD